MVSEAPDHPRNSDLEDEQAHVVSEPLARELPQIALEHLYRCRGNERRRQRANGLPRGLLCGGRLARRRASSLPDAGPIVVIGVWEE